MIVKLIEPRADYPELSTGQTYCIIGIEADDYRLLDDRGRPYLYPADLFSIVDAGEPDDWVISIGDDSERYAYPAALNEPGFFEDFFEGHPEVIATFWRSVNQQLSRAA